MNPQQLPGLEAGTRRRPDVPGNDRRPRKSRRRRTTTWVLVPVLVLVLTAGLLLLLRVSSRDDPEADPGVVVGTDPLQLRTLKELDDFTSWLAANHVQGYIGEIGIPNDGDSRWLDLARKWFSAAHKAGLWVDAWSVGEWWGPDYTYAPFASNGYSGPVSRERPSGALLVEEARRSDLPVGVNVSGGEFGAVGDTVQESRFSNSNPGVYGHDYQYASRATFDYLRKMGMRTVRLPFRWERIQPRLRAELDGQELGRLRGTVQSAEAAGLQVILDVQNFGAYQLDENGVGERRAIGTPEVTRADFADLWRRLSAAFAADPGVLAYDLMNEPAHLPSADGMTPAQLWEAASQDAVTAVRARGDHKLIMVPGYNLSHAADWAAQHPRAWISDPDHNIRYTAHHYWQSDEHQSYNSAMTDATRAGF